MQAAIQAYDRWHEAKATQHEPARADRYWHLLARQYLGELEGLRVLEIGCGRGGFAKYLADLGAEVVACDFSPKAVEITRRLLAGRKRCRVLVADVQALPFEDQSFDLVVSLETLEHVPDPDKALGELVRVTRRGGRLIVTTPNYLSLVGLHRLCLRLFGRTFKEAGQPINQPLTLLGRMLKLRRLRCRVDGVDGRGHYVSLPRPVGRTIELRWLERPRALTKWFALHSVTAATRL